MSQVYILLIIHLLTVLLMKTWNIVVNEVFAHYVVITSTRLGSPRTVSR